VVEVKNKGQRGGASRGEVRFMGSPRYLKALERRILCINAAYAEPS
jgi:hypothetical protein